ncbi:NTP transferase domain-containing protein [Gramella jeungdoensis]|uniref:Probable molybdenum cofactor guanylyltransferase n=1 Tax=Gramella jeungdoensis TaxID=708091 RepID=A0ABT0Z0K8_9FLAO|nr:NTP transferase domain-containing protein [Gramella jeungdoensis]MCM8569261.1 NTP transferase domain-containing protein [Gramella jeungdoensis]
METKLYGLVLAGGKSSRMGTDKGILKYHGKPQRDHLYEMLQEVCDEVFLSVRSDQEDEIPEKFRTIADMNEVRGPQNGMQSAHKTHPEAAWLIVATDLPLLNKDALLKLIVEREKEKVATAYAVSGSDLPEPLCAIWEPRSFDLAKEFISETGNTCPRKFLINSDIKIIHPDDDAVLMNANDEDDYKEVKKILSET